MIPFSPPTHSTILNRVQCHITATDIHHLNGLHFPEAAKSTAMDAVAEAIENELSNNCEVRITQNSDGYAYHVHHQSSHYSECLSDRVENWIGSASSNGKVEPIDFTVEIPSPEKILEMIG